MIAATLAEGEDERQQVTQILSWALGDLLPLRMGQEPVDILAAEIPRLRANQGSSFFQAQSG